MARKSLSPFIRYSSSFILLFALLGCQGNANNSSADATAADARARQEKKPNYETIRRGRAPFSVLLAPGGHINVVHLADETNTRVNKVILDTTVPPNSVITVSPNGIRVNAQVKAAGPFKRNHTYEVRLIK